MSILNSARMGKFLSIARSTITVNAIYRNASFEARQIFDWVGILLLSLLSLSSQPFEAPLTDRGSDFIDDSRNQRICSH
jgi:hypothetical protein